MLVYFQSENMSEARSATSAELDFTASDVISTGWGFYLAVIATVAAVILSFVNFNKEF